MHPAPSVIAFTVFSGLGFGLLAWLGLGLPDVYGWTAFVWFFAGYALAVGGLLASVFHLGNPRNAYKAFSQWRSSWLSREGVLSVAALVTLAASAIARVFFETPLTAFGWIAAILCIATVFSTSMIYAQLKTVPRWNMPATPVVFVLSAVAGGALLVAPAVWATGLLVLLGLAQIGAWRLGDARFQAVGSSIETATGLGPIGKVRQLEPPHTGENYLTREMAFQVGRKHAEKLRVIGLLCMVVLPVAVLWLIPGSGGRVLATLVHLGGMMAVRWLFFAQAEHVMRLYYDR